MPKGNPLCGFELLRKGGATPMQIQMHGKCILQSSKPKSQITSNNNHNLKLSLKITTQNNCSISTFQPTSPPSQPIFGASFGSGTSTSDPYGGAELKRFTFGAFTVVSPFSVPHGTLDRWGGGVLGLNLQQ